MCWSDWIFIFYPLLKEALWKVYRGYPPVSFSTMMDSKYCPPCLMTIQPPVVIQLLITVNRVCANESWEEPRQWSIWVFTRAGWRWYSGFWFTCWSRMRKSWSQFKFSNEQLVPPLVIALPSYILSECVCYICTYVKNTQQWKFH